MGKGVVDQVLISWISLRLWNDSGDGPDEGRHLTGNGDHDLVDVFASGDKPAVALAESHLRLPAQVLDDFGELFQAEL